MNGVHGSKIPARFTTCHPPGAEREHRQLTLKNDVVAMVYVNLQSIENSDALEEIRLVYVHAYSASDDLQGAVNQKTRC